MVLLVRRAQWGHFTRDSAHPPRLVWRELIHAPDTAAVASFVFRHESVVGPGRGEFRSETECVQESSYRPGNAEDFDRLYRESYPRVLRTLIGVLGDRAAAEDCTQEAFVKAYRAWATWRADGPAEAWLHRIAIRIAISHLRHAKLGTVTELLRRLGRPDHHGQLADVVVESDSLLTALRSLPPDQAAAIVLRHHHGYSNREIATALRIPESTVASRLAMARQRLAAMLGDGGSPSLRPDRARNR
jgi:RNA polymerase sigma-70 factor, ECF subfamily